MISGNNSTDLNIVIFISYRFISESKGESLLDFYNNYKYRPQTSEDTAVFEWKFLERLQHKHVDVAELFYLISVEMDTPRDFASLDDFDPTKDPIDDRHFYLNHVAGNVRAYYMVRLRNHLLKECF